MSREAIDDLKTEEGTVVAYFGVARELREAGREGRRERERERIRPVSIAESQPAL